MICAKCSVDTMVADSRRIGGGVWRRRRCPSCGDRFTTREVRTDGELAAVDLRIVASIRDGQIVLRAAEVGDAAPAVILREPLEGRS